MRELASRLDVGVKPFLYSINLFREVEGSSPESRGIKGCFFKTYWTASERGQLPNKIFEPA